MALTRLSPVRCCGLPTTTSISYRCFVSIPSLIPTSPHQKLQAQHPSRPLQRRTLAIQFPFSPTKRHASTASPTNASSDTSQLTWDEFLRLRRVRRYYNIGASVGTSFASLIGGMGILSQQNLGALSQQMFGLDPFVVLGLCATGFGVLGWLIGPIVGTAIFRLMNSSKSAGMAAKEKDFFERIRKYRVDPSSSSMQNPAPDYYGEKITSVAGYRQWLKDQRAFNKKRKSFV